MFSSVGSNDEEQITVGSDLNNTQIPVELKSIQLTEKDNNNLEKLINNNNKYKVNKIEDNQEANEIENEEQVVENLNLENLDLENQN